MADLLPMKEHLFTLEAFDLIKRIFLLFLQLQEAECGYVILIMAVFWVTEALPISVTALLPVFLFPVVGILSVKDASQQYINVSVVSWFVRSPGISAGKALDC